VWNAVPPREYEPDALVTLIETLRLRLTPKTR
jgi:hypothetical protein